MNVDDPNGYRNRLPRAERALEESDIDERDKQSIKDFLVSEKADDAIERHTMASHINDLRLSSRRADVLLVEMDKMDWDRFVVETLEEVHCLSVGTINKYKAAARSYFKWLGRDWWEDIAFGKRDPDKEGPDPEDLFTQTDIDAMLEQGDARGKVILALYADLGWRASAIASIKVGGVDLKGETAVVSINEDAPVKGAEGNSPLTFSRGYVVSFLRGDHPCPERDDAPLIHKKNQYSEGDRATSVSRIRGIVKDMAEDAGIDRDRVNLHNFRHTAVTRWRYQGIPDHRIEKRVKWVEGSDMFRIYDNPEEEDTLQEQAIAFGAADPEDFADGGEGREPGDGLTDCMVCGADVRVGARYCQICGNPMSVEAAQGASPDGLQEPEETAEDLASIDDVLDEMGRAAVIERLVQRDPSLLDDVDLD